MDSRIKTLLEQKLAALAREQDAELMTKVNTAWKKVSPAPDCIWIGDLMKDVRHACHVAVVERGRRVAAMLADTLRALKVCDENGLNVELGKLLDPLFPEDLYLAPVLNCRGVFERHGNPRRFDECAFEHELTLARVGIINASREARAKAQLAIDEYLLSVKPLHEEPKGFWAQVWEATNLRPGFFGIAIDLKKLFSRKKQPARD